MRTGWKLLGLIVLARAATAAPSAADVKSQLAAVEKRLTSVGTIASQRRKALDEVKARLSKPKPAPAFPSSVRSKLPPVSRTLTGFTAGGQTFPDVNAALDWSLSKLWLVDSRIETARKNTAQISVSIGTSRTKTEIQEAVRNIKKLIESDAERQAEAMKVLQSVDSSLQSTEILIQQVGQVTAAIAAQVH